VKSGNQVRENSADTGELSIFIEKDPTSSEFRSELEELHDRATIRNPYFSPEWLIAWLARQPDEIRPFLLLARTGQGRLDGFWPFVERPGLLGSKGLWPFVYDEANYFDPVATPEGAKALVKGMKAQLKGFLFCWVPLMRNAFWQEILEPETQQGKFLTLARMPRKTALIEPPVDDRNFEDFLGERLGAKSRKSLRYDQRKLAEQGNVAIETVDSFEDVRAIMPATCLVEVESWKSKEGAGLYSIRGKRGFFFELLPELAKSGRVRVSVMRLEDQPIAWQIDLLDSGYLGVHHLAFDKAYAKYSPGKQLLISNLRQAWEDGRMVDFLPGNYDYKEKWSSRVEPVRELHWFRRSLRGYLAIKLIRWNVKARKKIRERAQPTKAGENFLRAIEE
jgi:CelD/BcsL family acetyltransferase involved in cellulose biosynthesis